MLLPRILTALVLIPLVILAIIKLPAMYFSLFIAIIALMACLGMGGTDWTGKSKQQAFIAPGFVISYVGNSVLVCDTGCSG